jgi:phosphoribosylanthranilate isomerase
MNIKNIKMKVCGMRDVNNMLEVSRLHPDYMGFIFYAASPRFVGDDFNIPENFPATTKRVGVFVNESTEAILKRIRDFELDFVQLHGNESVQQCKELKNHQVGIIKVFSVDDDMDFAVTKNYGEVVDFFLFDTKGKCYGGNAATFNWGVLTKYDQKIPFFLSGGITPDNIAGIQDLMELNLQAIDVNSGVEIKPAIKDVKKIMAIKAVLNSKILKE